MAGYNFPTLEVGEAFIFAVSGERDAKGKLRDIARVRQAASAYKRRSAPEGWNYTVRKISETQGECRRIA